MPVPLSTFKDHSIERELFSRRIWISAGIVLLLALILLIRYYRLQIVQHEHFTTQSDANRIHTQAIAPARGMIKDANGVVLAQSHPSFALTLVKERVPDMALTLAQLKQLLDLDDSEISKFRERLRRRQRPYEPVPLRNNLDDEQMARIAVNQYRLPGVEIDAEMVRSYPLGDLFAHSVGYVGRINEKEAAQLAQSNRLDAYSGIYSIGKTGLEKFYEDTLLGVPGAQNVETDVHGRVLRTLDRKDPQIGSELTLFLDTRLQQVATEALAGRRGAVVAIDVNTGGVMVAVSTPSYDPNPFITGIKDAEYKALRDSPDVPLLNRFMQGTYPPGSTVKPMVALAGLDMGFVTPSFSISDPGFFTLPGQEHRYRDWKKGGHGNGITVRSAIEQSCDIYFYQLANRMGIDRIHEFLQPFGFGELTGVDMPSERPGVLPSRQWKRKTFKQPWYPGDTINAGIGQGYMLSTPMQLANATAIVARRGLRIRPRFVKAINGIAQPPEVDIPIILKDPSNWTTIIDAMHDVAQAEHGTAAKVFRTTPYTVAGKTGTAQVVGIAQNAKYDASKLSARQLDHGLFIAFAPVEHPRIAVAVMVENGGSGSGAAAPVAKRVLDAYMMPDTNATPAAAPSGALPAPADSPADQGHDE